MGTIPENCGNNVHHCHNCHCQRSIIEHQNQRILQLEEVVQVIGGQGQPQNGDHSNGEVMENGHHNGNGVHNGDGEVAANGYYEDDN